jgi:hypothetical protein
VWLLHYLDCSTGTITRPKNFLVGITRAIEWLEAIMKDGRRFMLINLVLFFQHFEVHLECPTNKMVCLFVNNEQGRDSTLIALYKILHLPSFFSLEN